MEGATLPELSAVPWRRRASPETLERSARLWLATTLAHVVPFCATAALLVAIRPWLAPVAVLALVQAWVIPELYANRGAKVARPRGQAPESQGPEAVAAGLVGDLVGHEARETFARTGLVVERGALGVWIVGEAGALLVAPGGRRTYCWCVRVPDPALPAGDRIASLVLALREDETGFATVANMAFAGATWRIRRRLPRAQRPALDAARAAAKR